MNKVNTGRTGAIHIQKGRIVVLKEFVYVTVFYN